MRELHPWHGEHRRHAPDAAADTSRNRAGDSPKHEVRRDPAVRVAKHLEYRKTVEAYEARHAAAQPRPQEQPRSQEVRPEPQEARPEHAPPESRDKPSGKIAERRIASESQEEKQRKPERSRLPSDSAMQVAVGVTVFASSVADAVNVLPGKWDAVAASFIGVLAAGVAWGNKRWKDKHGNRPEG